MTQMLYVAGHTAVWFLETLIVHHSLKASHPATLPPHGRLHPSLGGPVHPGRERAYRQCGIQHPRGIRAHEHVAMANRFLNGHPFSSPIPPSPDLGHARGAVR